MLDVRVLLAPAAIPMGGVLSITPHRVRGVTVQVFSMLELNDRQNGRDDNPEKNNIYLFNEALETTCFISHCLNAPLPSSYAI